MPQKTHCIKCRKEINKPCKNRKEHFSGLCRDCLIKERRQIKLEKWLQNGDTGCGVSSTIRGTIRDYIYNKQHNQCAICRIKNEWNGKKLNFILDHIDGDASNNKEQNLRLICPNCDSQLPTYKSKNKNSARTFRTNGELL